MTDAYKKAYALITLLLRTSYGLTMHFLRTNHALLALFMYPPKSPCTAGFPTYVGTDFPYALFLKPPKKGASPPFFDEKHYNLNRKEVPTHD